MSSIWPVLRWPTSYPAWNRLPLSTIINWKLEINGSELSTSLPVCIWVTCLNFAWHTRCFKVWLKGESTHLATHSYPQRVVIGDFVGFLLEVDVAHRKIPTAPTASSSIKYFFLISQKGLSDSVLMKIVFYM